jgi:RHS repeat-associated protein
MDFKPLRRAAALCALLAALATCGLAAAPARAQPLGDTERQAPDENGVDAISGKFSLPVRAIAAGRPGEGGLVYAVGWAGGQYYDSFRLELLDTAGVAYVTIYGARRRFARDAGGNYTPADADGGSLVFDSGLDGFVFTDRDGTAIRFPKALGDTGLGSLVTARADRVTRPDGETIDYHYRLEPGQGCSTFPCTPLLAAARVQSVTSTLGHQLKAVYASDAYGPGTQSEFKRLVKVVAINNAVDACDPGADACAGLTSAWPELTLGMSGTTRTFTDNLARTTSVATGASGPTSLTSPAGGGADLSLTYDASGRVATLAQGGGSWGYSYADSGGRRTTTVTQPLGGAKTYVSDLAIKRVLGVTDALGRTTSFQYDASGRLTRTTLPEGNYAQITYDGRGNVTQALQAAKPGSGLADIVATAAFPAACANPKTCNRPTRTTDERGFVTDYSYDSNHGGLLIVTAPAATTGAVRPQARLTYSSLSAYYKNSAGTIVAAPSPVYRLTAISACRTQASCAGGADEVKTTLAYGSPGTANNLFVSSLSRGAGDGSLTAVGAFAYDAFGNLTSADGPLPGSSDTAGFRYDPLRRLTTIVSPDPDGTGALKYPARRMSYDSDGNLIRIQSGTTTSLTGAFSLLVSVARTELGYDTFGRRISEALQTGPLPGGPGTPITHMLVQHSYDIKGRLECTARRMNSATFGSPPASACTPATAGALGPDRIVKNVYDTADQTTQTRTAAGTTLEAAEAAATYTNNGLLQTLTDGENNETSYEYDGHDRLAKTRFPSTTKGAGTSSTTDYEQPTYETTAGGTRTSDTVAGFRNRAGETIAFAYDALGRPTLKDVPEAGGDVAFAYDLLGLPLSALYSATGLGISASYDALGRETATTTNLDGTARTYSFQHDLAGNRTRLTHPDGPWFDYAYDALGRMKTIKDNAAATLVTLSYDDSGRRVGATYANGAATSYGYDWVGRLTSLAHDLAGTAQDVTFGYAYNPASQIVSRTASNDLYSFAQANSNIAYTANGLNQYSTVGGGAATYDARGNLLTEGGRSVAYDSENKLITIATPQLNGVLYDPLGRFRAVTAGTTTAALDFVGPDLLAMRVNGGATTERYAFGPGMDEPMVGYDGAGTRLFFHADERGSIVARSDSAGSAAGRTYAYDEYGRASAYSSRFLYAGKLHLGGVNAYYNNARFYDYALGRFLQPDPIGYQGGMNLYAYVGGDPVNFIDPLGLQLTCDDPVRCLPDGTLIVTGHRPRGSGSGSSDASGTTCGRPGPTAGFQRSACVAVLVALNARPKTPLPIAPRLDPNPDPRRDGCGNILPPASRRYSLPPGYKHYVDPLDRTVRDPNGKVVNNPYYQYEFNHVSINVKGVVSSLAWLGWQVSQSLVTGAVMRWMWGEKAGGAIMAGNRTVSSAGEAAFSPGGPCSR